MIELDLAFDAEALTLHSEAATELHQESIWRDDLCLWIDSMRTDPTLPCPSPLREADEVSLGLRFTDDATIRELNSTWRQRDEATDVLSFATLDDTPHLPSTDSVELGDIVISVETASRQAKEHQHSLRHELRWLVSHGLLHLLGWDHPDDASLQTMLSQQERLLENGGSVQIPGVHTMDADISRDAH